MRSRLLSVTAVGLLVAGCGSSSNTAKTVDPNAQESSPAGDIPDDQAFVAYAPAHAGVTVKVPEGWARRRAAGAATFTDKLNAVRIETRPAAAPLTAAAVRRTDVPRLARSVRGFRSVRISSVSRKAGPAVRITYLAAARPNPVTGQAGTDAVERYLFVRGGRELVLTLSGPKGADNVDPWRTITDSVRFTR